MREHFSDQDLRAVLGADLSESGIIDRRIEEAYIMIRNSGKRSVKSQTGKNKKHSNPWKGIGIGLVSAAAVLTLKSRRLLLAQAAYGQTPPPKPKTSGIPGTFHFSRNP